MLNGDMPRLSFANRGTSVLNTAPYSQRCASSETTAPAKPGMRKRLLLIAGLFVPPLRANFPIPLAELFPPPLAGEGGPAGPRERRFSAMRAFEAFTGGGKSVRLTN